MPPNAAKSLLGAALRVASAPRLCSRAALAILLAVHGGLLACSAAVNSPTYDEAFHLAAGLRRLVERRFDLDLGNPPLPAMVAAIPLALASPRTDWHSVPKTVPVGRDFVAANGPRIFWLVTLGRWACIAFSLMGGYLCYRWARELYGAPSGWLAVTLWCACPNILAHGALVTADMAATTLGLTACYAFWRWLESPTWARAGWAGLGLGLAELAKYVWAPLYVVWPLVWLAWAWASRRGAARPRLRSQAVQLAGLVFLSVYVINLGYLFEATFHPLNGFPIGSTLLSAIGATRAESPLRWLGSVPMPLPANYVHGIEAVDRWFEQKHRSYLHGLWSERGWWYYYLVGLGLKVPLGTWLLVLVAACLSSKDAARSWRHGTPQWEIHAKRRTQSAQGCVSWGGLHKPSAAEDGLGRPSHRRFSESHFTNRRYNADLKTELLLPGMATFVVLFVSVVTTDQSHVRFVLPALPFLFVWASKAARAFTLHSRRVAILAAACLAWSLASSLAVFPHSLSYFNELAGGPKRGGDWLLDSNIDWGQDLFYLKRWLNAHPEARPPRLAYFGSIDPQLVGIASTLPPRERELTRPVAQPRGHSRRALQPGWYAVSENLLHGYVIAIPNGTGGLLQTAPSDYTYFQRFTPVARAGYSIYIYHLDERDIDVLGRTSLR